MVLLLVELSEIYFDSKSGSKSVLEGRDAARY